MMDCNRTATVSGLELVWVSLTSTSADVVVSCHEVYCRHLS